MRNQSMHDLRTPSEQKHKLPIFQPSPLRQPQIPTEKENVLFFAKTRMPIQNQQTDQPKIQNIGAQQEPSKISSHYEFRTENMPKVLCHYHFDQYITLFCKNPNCLMPMCPQCVKIHSQEHQSYGNYGQFETLDNCLTQTYSDVAKYCNLITDEIEKVKKFTSTKGKEFGDSQERIKYCRTQAHQIIENFFDTIEKEVVFEIEKNRSFVLAQSIQFQKYLTQRWSQLMSYLQKLNTPKCVKNLIKHYVKDINRDNQQYLLESQTFMAQLNNYIPQIIVDQSALYSLNLELAKYVTIKQCQLIQPQSSYFEDNSFSNKYISTQSNEPQFEVNKKIQSIPHSPSEDIQFQYEIKQSDQFKKSDNKHPQIHPYLRTPGKEQQKRYFYQ